MNRFGQRLLVWGALTCLAVFIGVDLATQGIETIHGPVQHDPMGATGTHQHGPLSAEGAPTPSPSPVVADAGSPPAQAAPVPAAPAGSDSLVNRFADTSGSLLRGTAQKGVELFVSILDGALD